MKNINKTDVSKYDNLEQNKDLNNETVQNGKSSDVENTTNNNINEPTDTATETKTSDTAQDTGIENDPFLARVKEVISDQRDKIISLKKTNEQKRYVQHIKLADRKNTRKRCGSFTG